MMCHSVQHSLETVHCTYIPAKQTTQSGDLNDHINRKTKSIASRGRSSQILGDWIPDYYYAVDWIVVVIVLSNRPNCRAMTPTSACEIECNIEPLDVRRDAAIVTTYER